MSWAPANMSSYFTVYDCLMTRHSSAQSLPEFAARRQRSFWRTFDRISAAATRTVPSSRSSVSLPVSSPSPMHAALSRLPVSSPSSIRAANTPPRSPPSSSRTAAPATGYTGRPSAGASQASATGAAQPPAAGHAQVAAPTFVGTGTRPSSPQPSAGTVADEVIC